jgi:hypothetical protein
MAELETQFAYEFSTPSGKKCSVNLGVEIPFERDFKEFCYAEMRANNIPVYLEEDFMFKLSRFIDDSTRTLLDFEATQQLSSYFSDEKGQAERMEKWASSYQEGWLMYSRFGEKRDGIQFHDIYHSLIHSPAFETLIQLERKYGHSVRQTREAQKVQLELQEHKHSKELQDAMNGLGMSHSDSDINRMTRTHLRAKDDLEHRFGEELRRMQESQKRDYREWLSKLYEDQQNGIEVKPFAKTDDETDSSSLIADSSMDQRREESFTIHLGSQLKTMHNLRLMCCNTFDLCKHGLNSEQSGISPHHLQTSLSLYSGTLSALVLLVDGKIHSHTGNKEKLASVCRKSTDFHFQSIDAQLDTVREQAAAVKVKRQMFTGQKMNSPMDSLPSPSGSIPRQASSSGLSESGTGPLLDYSLNLDSSGGSQSLTMTPTPTYTGDLNWPRKVSYGNGYSSGGDYDDGEDAEGPTLQQGDFYITQHSTLSEVHVVFHLVASELPSEAIISTRHPVMTGLRNCLRIATRHNIGTLTLPLLLVEKMTADMTVSWCLKRAEVVFKCVKGYMLETTSGTDTGSTVIQFLVPPAITDEMFTEFCDLLPKVFRMTTARNLKPTANQKRSKSPKPA